MGSGGGKGKERKQGCRATDALEVRAPPPPDSIATVVNSSQNRVSITLCITLNAKTGKIGLVLVTLHSD